jgi:hypothetical protein
MRKLVLAVAVVCLAVSSSFASWSYFPPKDAGSGEVKLGLGFGMPASKTITLGLDLGASYTIIDGLEASAIIPFPLMSSFDGNSMDGYAGLGDPIIGVRYWLPMGLGFFVDATIPVDTDDFVLGAGVQYSTNFTSELSLGSEVGLIIPFADDIYMDMAIGLELEYSLGTIAPYLGTEMTFDITKPEGKDTDFVVDLWVGAAFDINEMFSASADVTFGVAGHGDNTPITIGASFSFNF